MKRHFDHIVLTAANEAQARGYRAQLDWRLKQGVLDATTRYHVVADPGGRRVGSLGATLGVLRHLADQLLAERPAKNFAELFADQRILICHSGGDSRRLPAYAAQGKIFVPLPTSRRGQPAALFDLILDNVEKLPAPSQGQVLIYTGDVLLTFDPNTVDFDLPGVVGVAYPGSLDVGSRHGVYAPGSGKGHDRTMPVRDFLQKPDEAEARAAGAVDPVNRVLIDTGILSFDPKTTEKLLKYAGLSLRGRRVIADRRGVLADLEAGRSKGLDLYEEFTMALPDAMTAARYQREVIGANADAAHQRRLMGLHRALRGVKFAVNVLPWCDFFHIGSSREFLVNIATLNRTAQTYNFAHLHGSAVCDGVALEGSFIYDSVLDHRRIRAAGQTLIEACDVDVPLQLDGGNILVGLPALRGHLSGPAVRLRKGLGLVVLPVGGRDWAAVLFGIEDDFKGAGDRCGFLNGAMREWQREHRVSDAMLWPGDEPHDLWQAKLWRVGTLKQTIGHAMALASSGMRPAGKRFNMRELMGRVNHERLIAHRQDIARRVGLRNLAERLLTDNTLAGETVVGDIHDRREAMIAQQQISEARQRANDRLFDSRAMKLAAMIARAHPTTGCNATRLEQEAFEAIGDAVAKHVGLAGKPRVAGILQDQVVWVTTPVRIDLAGGWSDTPPICAERGGAVLNAAVTLNGQYPVQAMAKLNEEGVIRLSSIDLGQRVEITTTEQLLDHHNPRDWAALPKAALLLAGVGPGDAKQKLSKWLDVLGGGLDLTIFSSLPKGSGMGTSSILGAAVLACLDRVLGVHTGHDDLIARVSVLEQRMTTGGGWQDQVGGVYPGIKLSQTQPGPEQLPTLRFTALPPEVSGRMLLYFTGYKRMAKNILQNVVGRYLARDPAALRIIDELKAGALAMKQDLDERNFRGFAAGVRRYWELKKAFDPGSTTPMLQKLIGSVDRWCEATLLPGAGGGGFVFMIARDQEAVGKIRRQLERNRPNEHARFFDFALDPTGLKVTTL